VRQRANAPRLQTTRSGAMNLYTDNTHELVKIFYLSEFLALDNPTFGKVMDGFRDGKYELIVIDEE